jgi:hypothetical protein
MRILFTALLAALFLTGCPDDKKGDSGSKAKDTKTKSSKTAKPKDSGKADKKDDEEGGW